MNKENVVIKNSRINGKGVFAARDFKRGEIVLRWDTTHTIDEKQVEKLGEEDKKYITLVNGHYTKMQEPERFVNHSCEPNTYIKNFCDIALKDIVEGEEITSDYTNNLPPNIVMQCNCGSLSCKGVIKNSI